jgi:hypothetical protein
MLYPQYANNISAMTQPGGSLIQKIKHELINPLPGKLPRYDNVIIMTGKEDDPKENKEKENWPSVLMKAVNKFQGYEHVKSSIEFTDRGTGISFTQLRNTLKTKTPDQAFEEWSNAFNNGKSGAQPLPPDWIKHLMDVSRTGMKIQQPVQQQPVQQPVQQVQQPVQQQPVPVAEQRLFNALIRPVSETARMSAAVKLQRAWDAQQAKSAASRERAKQLLNPPKPQEPKKDEKPLDELKFFKSGEVPKAPAKPQPTSAEMRKYFEKDKPIAQPGTGNKNDANHAQKVYTRHAESWKDNVASAALAGAMALGSGGTAQAGDDNTNAGWRNLPDIVAHITMKVNGNTIEKEINLGTEYQSPMAAKEAVAKWLKEKGITNYTINLERVKPKVDEKIKGADGKACWKGKRYAGTKNGKDVCIPVSEDVENIMAVLINKIIVNEAIQNNKR